MINLKTKYFFKIFISFSLFIGILDLSASDDRVEKAPEIIATEIINGLPPELQLKVFSKCPKTLLVNKELSENYQRSDTEIIENIKKGNLQYQTEEELKVIQKYYPFYYFSNDSRQYMDKKLKMPDGVKVETTKFRLNTTEQIVKYIVTENSKEFCIINIPICDFSSSDVLIQLSDIILPLVSNETPIKILINNSKDRWQRKYVAEFIEQICQIIEKSNKQIVAIDLPQETTQFNIDRLLKLPKIKMIFVHPQVIFRDPNYKTLLEDQRIVPHTKNITEIPKIFNLDGKPDLRDVLPYLQKYTPKNVITPLFHLTYYPFRPSINAPHVRKIIKKLLKYKLISLEEAVKQALKDFYFCDDYELTEFFLNQGMNPNSQFKNGDRLLHTLVKERKNIKTIELFLQYGADPNRTDSKNLTALEYLYPYNGKDLQYIELLVRYADITVKNLAQIIVTDPDKVYLDNSMKSVFFLFKNYQWKKTIPFLAFTVAVSAGFIVNRKFNFLEKIQSHFKLNSH